MPEITIHSQTSFRTTDGYLITIELLDQSISHTLKITMQKFEQKPLPYLIFRNTKDFDTFVDVLHQFKKFIQPQLKKFI